MNILSTMQQRGPVPFPAFTAERVYMREFRIADGLPSDIARWQPTVDAMLDGVETDQPIYLMVDQQRVPAGATSRRPGPHIDGWWIAAGHRTHLLPNSDPSAIVGAHRLPGHITKMAHGMPGRGSHSNPVSRPNRGAHEWSPKHRDHHNTGSRHATSVRGQWAPMPSRWKTSDFDLGPEGLILASDVQGCRGFSGVYDDSVIGEGGECSRLDLSTLTEIPMRAGMTYAGNVLTVHESLPVAVDSLRTVVRLNVKGWEPQ